MKKATRCMVLWLMLAIISPAFAQMTFSGQLIQRGEYRHGYGKLMPDSVKPATFISQRMRLQADYKLKNVRFYASLQDIRTWGNTAQTNLSDDFLSVHEAWALISTDSFLSFKLGRQELNYDNARFLGNLDWALQARSHDFAMIRYERSKHKLHLGAGYNQHTEGFWGNAFFTPNQYKTAHMLWYNYKNEKAEISFLFWNNGKQFLQSDSTGAYIQNKTRYMQTLGLPTLRYNPWKNGTLSAFVYYQTGKDVTNRDESAFDISARLSHVFKWQSNPDRHVRTSLGFETLSGKSNISNTTRATAFSPLYGTNHMHNGYMDYFFVGGRQENSTGLNDYFLRIQYTHSAKWFISVNTHYFNTQAAVYRNNSLQSNYLGTEADLTLGIKFNENLSIQGGYSQFFSGTTPKNALSYSADPVQNWVYLMLIIRPAGASQFIGLLN